MAIPFKSTISVSQIENVSLINSKNGGLLLRGGYSNFGGNYLDLGSTSLVALYSSQQSNICIGDSYPSSSSDNWTPQLHLLGKSINLKYNLLQLNGTTGLTGQVITQQENGKAIWAYLPHLYMHKVEMYAITTSDIYNFTIGFFDNQSQPYTKTNLYTALEKLEASNQQVCAIISGYHRVKPDSSVSKYAYIPILYLQSPSQSDIRITHTTYAYEKSDGTVKVAGNYAYLDSDVISWSNFNTVEDTVIQIY